MRVPLIGVLGLCLLGSMWADEGLIDQIEQVSRRLRADPGSAELFVRRAGLLRRWGRLEAAMADLRQAKRLDPDARQPLLVEARVLRDAGHTQRGLLAFRRYLEREAMDMEARRDLVMLLAKVGRTQTAALEQAWVLKHSPQVNPDMVMLLHSLLLEAGLKEAALESLEQGISQLGPLISLELPAFELELMLGRTEAAIGRIEAVAARTPRMDGWELHRARALLAGNRTTEAKAAYRRALAKLQDLPQRRRSKLAARSMLDQARRGLALLAKE